MSLRPCPVTLLLACLAVGGPAAALSTTSDDAPANSSLLIRGPTSPLSSVSLVDQTPLSGAAPRVRGAGTFGIPGATSLASPGTGVSQPSSSGSTLRTTTVVEDASTVTFRFRGGTLDDDQIAGSRRNLGRLPSGSGRPSPGPAGQPNLPEPGAVAVFAVGLVSAAVMIRRLRRP